MAKFGGKDRSDSPGGQGSDTAGGKAGAGPADSHDSGGSYSVGKDRYGSAGTIAAAKAAASKALPPLNAPQKPFPGSIQGYAPISEQQALTRGSYLGAIKDKKNIGNTTLENAGNTLADLGVNLSEINPAYQGMGHFAPDAYGVPHPAQADWGFDAVGAALGAAGGLAGIPAAGTMYSAGRFLTDKFGLTNPDWGKVNLGPDVLGGIGSGSSGAGWGNFGGAGGGTNKQGNIGNTKSGADQGGGFGVGGNKSLQQPNKQTTQPNKTVTPTPVTPTVAPTPPAPTWKDALAAATPTLRSDFNWNMAQRGLGANTLSASGKPVNWDDVFNQELAHRQAGIPVGAQGTDKASYDKAINQYLLSNFGSGALDDYQTRQRSDLTNSVAGLGLDKEFDTRFGQDDVQGYIDNIYNTQYGQAKTLLDNVKARGEFNDLGYNAALSDLNTQGTAGRSTLNDLAGSYLTTAKGTLNDALTGIYDKIGGYTLGSSYTPSADIGNIKSQENTLAGNLQGQILGAAPNIFDTSSTLQKASSQQGATSGGTLTDTLAQRQSNTGQRSRGLPSTGAF